MLPSIGLNMRSQRFEFSTCFTRSKIGRTRFSFFRLGQTLLLAFVLAKIQTAAYDDALVCWGKELTKACSLW